MILHCDRTLAGFRHLGNVGGLYCDEAGLRTLGDRVWAMGKKGALVSCAGGALRLHGGLMDSLLDIGALGSELVLLAKGGVLLTSGDGLRWKREPLQGAPDLRRILTLSSGVLAFGPGGILRQEAGGAWEPVAIKKGPTLLGGHAWVDGTVLLVGEKGRCLLSKDAGRTFKPVKMPTTVTLHAVHGNDRGNVLIVGDRGTLVCSSDGGKTWARGELPNKRYALVAAFVDDQMLLVSGSHQPTQVSLDGGKTWQEYANTHFQALSGPLTPGGPLWGLTFRGELLPLPLKWPPPRVPVRSNRHPDDDLGVDPAGAWIAQLGGVRWRSIDQGLTWEQTKLTPNPTADPAGQPFPQHQSIDGWSAKSKRVRIVTPDSVQTWTPKVSVQVYGQAPDVYCGVQLPSGTWLAAGEYGVMVRSTDRGATCTSEQLNDNTGSLTLLAARGDVILAGGWYSLAFRSTDDGHTWTKLAIPGRGTAIQQILWLDDHEVMLFLDRGGLALVSGDAGQTWREIPWPELPGWPPHFIKVARPTPGGGLLCLMKPVEE